MKRNGFQSLNHDAEPKICTTCFKLQNYNMQ
jgi:hypothetical protein